MPRAKTSDAPHSSSVPSFHPGSKIGIFPGTFDPITRGHLDIIDRGRKLFDHLIVAIGVNPGKDHLFPIEERLRLTRPLLRAFPNVSVEAYHGLTVDLVRRRHASAILRGLRNLTDIDYEFRVALTNRKVGGVETIFIMTREEFGFTSSNLIKQIVTLGGDPQQLHELLPPAVIKRIIFYRKNKLGPFAKTPQEILP